MSCQKLRACLRGFFLPLLLGALSSLAQSAQPGDGAAILAAVGTAFTYQGQLVDAGNPAEGAYDFRFLLFDADAGGSQVGATVIRDDVVVASGIFSVQLDFAAAAFDGSARWLAIEVRDGGSNGAYSLLSPRQAITATPYALSLRPGAMVAGSGGTILTLVGGATGLHANGSSRGVYGETVDGTGIFGLATGTENFGAGVTGQSYSSQGGAGVNGFASAATGTSYGVFGRSNSIPDGVGVYGAAVSASGTGVNYGVRGYSNSDAGFAGYFQGSGPEVVYVENAGYGRGIQAHAINDTAVWARTDNGLAGVDGWNDGPTGRGVSGYASSPTGSNHGVWGQSASTSGTGVLGWASAASGSTTGVYGESISTLGTGVYGAAIAGSGAATGVFGTSASASGGIGVYGYASASSGTNYGVWGYSNSPSGFAGYFNGRVSVTGNLSKGGGSFRIDHPLDPANQYLQHSFVESPDMMNVYNGNVFLDDQGEAWVELPDWFEALNRDFRYQLTPIGSWAPLYVADEVQGNRFRIAGGEPGLQVSWQVTGIRQDAWADAHRIAVEELKPESERGRYLHAVELGQPEALGLHHTE
jgi:hypothetical protein